MGFMETVKDFITVEDSGRGDLPAGDSGAFGAGGMAAGASGVGVRGWFEGTRRMSVVSDGLVP